MHFRRYIYFFFTIKQMSGPGKKDRQSVRQAYVFLTDRIKWIYCQKTHERWTFCILYYSFNILFFTPSSIGFMSRDSAHRSICTCLIVIPKPDIVYNSFFGITDDGPFGDFRSYAKFYGSISIHFPLFHLFWSFSKSTHSGFCRFSFHLAKLCTKIETINP